MKTIKKAQKREMQENGKNTVAQTKKPKLTNGIEAESDDQVPPNAVTEKPNAVNTSIFQFFKELTNNEFGKRKNAVVQLVYHINKTLDTQKRQQELKYTLKRLVRGCGASSNTSRCGFFTGLVSFLKYCREEELPLSWIFETMQKELHVGTVIANKEDADAVVGKILTCGAVLRSGRLTAIDGKQLEQITTILLQASKYRTYHASMAYAFLIEIMKTVPKEKFESVMWPQLQNELIRPWPKQTIQTVQCLIEMQRQFPHLVHKKFLKAHLEGYELLNANSYVHLHKMFWDPSNINIITHPAIETFAAYIGQCSKLSEFWSEVVDPGLQTPTKLLEIESLKIATDILKNMDVAKNSVADLLTPNFMRMFVEGLKSNKQKTDETLKAFYDEFQQALIEGCEKLQSEDHKVEVIRRLLQPPGTFNIENYTSSRIVHKIISLLGEEGVKAIFNFYKDIFVGIAVKDPNNSEDQWLHYQRRNAGFMLQHLVAHKSVKVAYDWREEQLKFFLTCGIFSVDNKLVICKKENAGDFSKTFSEQCRNMFFSSLQIKVNDLKREKDMLLDLVKFCNSQLQQGHAHKSLMLKNFNEKTLRAWNTMMENLQIKASAKKVKSIQPNAVSSHLELVFELLLLHMGLQLFREPDMACEAIDDLLKCIERTRVQQKQKKKAKDANRNEDEPEWIEVVVDLFLHLLSQNTNALRNIVNVLFPHFCSSMTLSAVHQILAMLDMASGENPLSARGDAGETSDEDTDDDEVNEENGMDTNDVNGSISEVDEDNDSDDNDDQDDDDDEEADEEDDDDVEEEEMDDEEDVTMTDKLRNAISQALMASGGVAAQEDDQESIDLNDMTEEEGRKLDQALANAFKAMRGAGGIGSTNKKSKKERMQRITVMHFRTRVLDLVEIYLDHNPSLMVSIEILLALYDMLRFCFVPELQPLQSKVERVINKLVENKSYQMDNDLTVEHFASFIRLIIEKETPALAFDIMNRVRNKSIVFLLLQSDKLKCNTQRSPVLELWQQYIEDYINLRNPPVNNTLLLAIFKLRWTRLWDLAKVLIKAGLTTQTRAIRRIQINEILQTLYRNSAVQHLDLERAKIEFKVIDNGINAHINKLCTENSLKKSSREIQTLFQLLLDARKTHNRLGVNSVLFSNETIQKMQELRKIVKLDSMNEYKRYCTLFKLPVIRKNDVQAVVQERTQDSADNFNGNDGSHSQLNGHADVIKEDHKRINKSKMKKLKKQHRMDAASVGLNVDFSFAQPADRTGIIERD